jgi:hypothetical protein
LLADREVTLFDSHERTQLTLLDPLDGDGWAVCDLCTVPTPEDALCTVWCHGGRSIVTLHVCSYCGVWMDSLPEHLGLEVVTP